MLRSRVNEEIAAENGAERVDVRSGRSITFQLLRGGIVDCSNKVAMPRFIGAGLTHSRSRSGRVVAHGIAEFGDAKVDHTWLAAMVYQDVAGLQIPMDDTLAMRDAHSAADFTKES